LRINEEIKYQGAAVQRFINGFDASQLGVVGD